MSGSVRGEPLTFLLLHDPFDTLAKFVQRVALLNQLEDRLEQCLGDVHFVHLPHFLPEGLQPCLTSIFYHVVNHIVSGSIHK